mmetsp:Transcript_36266/g.104307  ORF Transcript_36266/g.104307 Transcript_36266/m.104307 type:complete len:164 (-) Transcript_36266:68-559(-)
MPQTAVVSPQEPPTRGPDGVKVKMFSDVHRFLLQRHADIEFLRVMQARKSKLREESLAEVMRMLDHDTVERVAQIQKFTDEMERHTQRKMQVMQKQILEVEEAAQLAAGKANPEDRRKMQFKLDRLGYEVDTVRSGLVMVADAMEMMSENIGLDSDEEDSDDS